MIPTIHCYGKQIAMKNEARCHEMLDLVVMLYLWLLFLCDHGCILLVVGLFLLLAVAVW